jgi:hypothetical protein
MRQCVVPFCEKNTPRSKDKYCSSHRNEFFIRKISPYKELPPLWAFRKCKHHGWQPFEHFYYQKKCRTYICKPYTLATLKDKYCPIKRKAKRIRDWNTNRNSSLKRLFGIDQKDYEVLLIKQNNQCAICKKIKSQKNLDIDHCHDTKIIRGLLCRPCNLGLGYFKDNPELLIKAAQYLRR